MAFEVAQGGELFDLIAMTGAFSEKVCRYFFHQLIEVLEYLQKKGISHRDLKTENILLDKEYNIKLIGFEFASVEGYDTDKVGTESFMAPEILLGDPYVGQIADIFGAGLILFIMRTQKFAFRKANHKDEHYKYIIGNKLDRFWKTHYKGDESYFSDEFKNLVNGMIAYNPFHRFSLSEIKSHPWFNGPVPSAEEIKEEFDQRLEQVNQENQRQREEIPDFDLFEGSTVHREGGSEESDSEDSKECDEDSLDLQKFFPTSNAEDLKDEPTENIPKSTSEKNIPDNDLSFPDKILKKDESIDAKNEKAKTEEEDYIIDNQENINHQNILPN